jgi:geranylgeranylglycerol-phosphate geranylgeranyltransferase
MRRDNADTSIEQAASKAHPPSFFLNAVGDIIVRLEDDRNPLVLYILSFLAAIALRNLLEFLVIWNFPPAPVNWHNLIIHYNLFFISLGLAIILLIHILTKAKVSSVARIVLIGFILTPTVPIVDSLLQLVWKHDIIYDYAIPGKTEGLLKKYFLFFGDHQGASFGMRLEIFIAMILSSLYIYYKTSSLLRAALGAVLLYSLIFWGFGAVPFLIVGLERLAGSSLDMSERMLIDVYLLYSVALFLVIAYYQKPVYVKAIIKDIRLTRVLHYVLMVVIGFFILGFPESGERLFLPPDLIEFCFIILAVVFAGIFSAITNNLADIKIDRITNPERPSVTGIIPENDYKKIAYVALFLAMTCSLAAGYLTCFLVFCLIGNYFLYSIPPLRLKRIPFFSKGIISLNCIAMMLAGYTFAGKELRTFPVNIILFVLIFFTACINFIDIKDYEGDKAEGIKTLPVLLGLKWSKLAIGFFFIIAYALFPYLIGPRSVFPVSILFGVAIFFAINVKQYKERTIFLLYLLSGEMYLLSILW